MQCVGEALLVGVIGEEGQGQGGKLQEVTAPGPEEGSWAGDWETVAGLGGRAGGRLRCTTKGRKGIFLSPIHFPTSPPLSWSGPLSLFTLYLTPPDFEVELPEMESFLGSHCLALCKVIWVLDLSTSPGDPRE